MSLTARQAAAVSGADLRHVDTWIFDLDNTLYPMGGAIQAQMDARITAYVRRETGLDEADAFALQKRYLHEHGTTLAGLMAHHGVDPYGFLDEVHDVSLDTVAPDPTLVAALARLPGRRLVFTNASAGHAERVLARLELSALFEHVFHLEAAELTPKPQARAYEALIAAHGVTPRTSAFFEDTERNLAPAAALGMCTVLVGPHASASTAGFVDYRTGALAAFLSSARTGNASSPQRGRGGVRPKAGRGPSGAAGRNAGVADASSALPRGPSDPFGATSPSRDGEDENAPNHESSNS